MARARLNRLPRFNTIGPAEGSNVSKALRAPLSGYLGGCPAGGYWVEWLRAEWAGVFGVNHATPCNSATSGLLAACMAVGIGPGDEVWVSCYGMSATAAVAKVLGARVRFLDIEGRYFCLDDSLLEPERRMQSPKPKAVIVTNLFGHPAQLQKIREWCDDHKVWMIEDNAQAPFAMEGNRYAGTIGHIGVFSLNVHKHIQCGEGGVVVTDGLELAQKLNNAINHGELDPISLIAGLNLRMTEPIAAIACAQLAKAERVIERRRELALELTDMVEGISWIIPPRERKGCRHVYYLWTPCIARNVRHRFVAELNKRGFPIREGYSPLLNRVFRSDDVCPKARIIEEEEIAVFEVCAHDPSPRQRKVMRQIIKQVAGEMP